METSKDKIKNDKYRNWVKGTLGIEQTNRAVGEYVREKFILYLQGKATLNPQTNQSYLTPAELAHVKNDIKALFRQRLKSLLTYKRNKTSGREEWHWDKRTYNCAECIGTFQKILSLHKGQIGNLRANPNNPKSPKSPDDYKDIHWGNSNDTRNLPLEWAIAKIFMPRGNEKNNGPEDTDPSAMFGLMATCDLFTNPIKGGNLQQLINARNSLFHSSDNLVSDDTVEDYFDLMKNLLLHASCDPEVDQSIRDRLSEDIKKIEKLKESEMTMTLFEDAMKAIRIKRKAIYYDFEEHLCNNEPDQLRELLKLAVKLGSELQFLNDHFDDLKLQNDQLIELQKESDAQKNIIENFQKLIEEKKQQILEIDTQMKELAAENEKLKKESNVHKGEITRMQLMITNHVEEIRSLRRQYDHKESEIKDITRQRDDHYSKIEQLRLMCDKQENTITSLQKELDDQNLKIEDIDGHKRFLLVEIEELKTNGKVQTDEIEVLRQERTKHLILVKELHEKNEEQRCEIERKCEENDEMHCEISNLQEVINSKQSNITEQNREINNLHKQIIDKAEEMKTVLKENQDKCEEIKTLKTNIISLQVSVDELQNQDCDLKKQIDDMSIETALLIDEVKNLQYEKDGLNDNVQVLKEKIHCVRTEFETPMTQVHDEIEKIRKQKDNTEWEAVVIVSAFALGSCLLQGK